MGAAMRPLTMRPSPMRRKPAGEGGGGWPDGDSFCQGEIFKTYFSLNWRIHQAPSCRFAPSITLRPSAFPHSSFRLTPAPAHAHTQLAQKCTALSRFALRCWANSERQPANHAKAAAAGVHADASPRSSSARSRIWNLSGCLSTFFCTGATARSDLALAGLRQRSRSLKYNNGHGRIPESLRQY